VAQLGFPAAMIWSNCCGIRGEVPRYLATDRTVNERRVDDRTVRIQLEEFKLELADGGLDVTVDVDSGGSHDGRDRYYRWEVIEGAQQAQQWANFNEDAKWVRGLVRGRNSQLRVVLSFHHVGRALTGVAEVTSIGDLEDLDADIGSDGRFPTRRPVQCMLQPFTLTWRDNADDLIARFDEWCRDSLLLGLRAWADTLQA
jgi:hypothetical protein